MKSAKTPTATLNLERLCEEIEWWLERQEDRTAAKRGLAQDAQCSPGLIAKLSNRTQHNLSVELADRLLVSMDLSPRGTARHPRTGRNNKMVITHRFAINGHCRQPGETGRIKKVDFANAKLNEAQLRAIYRLHIEGGHSLRSIAAAGWEQWGYASMKTALTSLSDRLNSIGLKPRGRIEATIRASTTHGMGSRSNKKAYKRWHRKTFGPWPSDGPPPNWENVRSHRDWTKPPKKEAALGH